MISNNGGRVGGQTSDLGHETLEKHVNSIAWCLLDTKTAEGFGSEGAVHFGESGISGAEFGGDLTPGQGKC